MPLVVELAWRYLKSRAHAGLLSFPVVMVVLGLGVCGAAVVVVNALNAGFVLSVERWADAEGAKLDRSLTASAAQGVDIVMDGWTQEQRLALDEAVGLDPAITTSISHDRLGVFLTVSGQPLTTQSLMDDDAQDTVLMVSVTSSRHVEELHEEFTRWLSKRPATQALADLRRRIDESSRPTLFFSQVQMDRLGVQPGDTVVVWGGAFRFDGQGMQPLTRHMQVGHPWPTSLHGILGRETPVGNQAAMRTGMALWRGDMARQAATSGVIVTTVNYKVAGHDRPHEYLRSLLKTLGLPEEAVGNDAMHSFLTEMRKDLAKEKGNQESLIQTQSLVANIILTVLLAACAAQMVGMLYLLVQARRHEIAVLRSIGLSARKAGQVFVVMGLSVGVMSLVAGACLGALMTVYMNDVLNLFLTRLDLFNKALMPLPIAHDVTGLLLMALGGLVLSGLAGILPARRAASILPAQVFAEED